MRTECTFNVYFVHFVHVNVATGLCKDRGVVVRRVCDLDELSDMEDLKAVPVFNVTNKLHAQAW